MLWIFKSEKINNICLKLGTHIYLTTMQFMRYIKYKKKWTQIQTITEYNLLKKIEHLKMHVLEK